MEADTLPPPVAAIFLLALAAAVGPALHLVTPLTAVMVRRALFQWAAGKVVLQELAVTIVFVRTKAALATVAIPVIVAILVWGVLSTALL